MTSNANDCTGRQHTHTHLSSDAPFNSLILPPWRKSSSVPTSQTGISWRRTQTGSLPACSARLHSLYFILVCVRQVCAHSAPCQSNLCQSQHLAQFKKKWTAGTVAARYPSLHDLGIIPLLEALLQEFQWRALKQDVQIPSQFISSRVHQLIRADRRYNMRGRVWKEHGVRDLYYTHANYPGFG